MRDNKDIRKIEKLDNVTIVYNSYTPSKDEEINKYLYLNSIKIYDSFGNELYGNYSDINEAYERLFYLIDRGVDAVIGPKAPVKDYSSGRLIPNYNQDSVGLYIVKEKQKRLVREKN
jgi:hypothetical protein